MKDIFTEQRARMVREQLRTRGIGDRRVLAAMASVPREEFVPEGLRAFAYDDCPEPIGEGQTISQPFTVAFMSQAAQLVGTERILEVGTGSGYGAAVLSLLGVEVHSIDRIPSLAMTAAERLERLGYTNVTIHVGDGSLGWDEAAPFDAIIVTAGSPALPPAYREQLAEGGRIVIPIGSYKTSQRLYRFRLTGKSLSKEDLGPFAFVPLLGAQAWPSK